MLKSKIDKSGYLLIYRKNVWTEAFCFHRCDCEMPCGTWCPLFHEPNSGMIRICNHKKFELVSDNRVVNKSPVHTPLTKHEPEFEETDTGTRKIKKEEPQNLLYFGGGGMFSGESAAGVSGEYSGGGGGSGYSDITWVFKDGSEEIEPARPVFRKEDCELDEVFDQYKKIEAEYNASKVILSVDKIREIEKFRKLEEAELGLETLINKETGATELYYNGKKVESYGTERPELKEEGLLKKIESKVKKLYQNLYKRKDEW